VLRWEKLDRGYNPESLKELLALNKSFKAVWDEYNRTGGAARRMRRNIELWYDLEKDGESGASPRGNHMALGSLSLRVRVGSESEC
jgi:hypothetical protein